MVKDSGLRILEDVRRRVGWELQRRGASSVTPEDVREITARLGSPSSWDGNGPPAPPDAPAAGPRPVARSRRARLGGWTSTYLVVFGVLLPAAALAIELATGACAKNYLDPIPTAGHVLLIGAVPAANLLVLAHRRDRSAVPGRLCGVLSGISIATSAYYAAVFLPALPIAVLLVAAYGLGLLPLSPMLALIACVAAHVHLRRRPDGLPRWVPGTGLWLAAGLLLLPLLDVLVCSPARL